MNKNGKMVIGLIIAVSVISTSIIISSNPSVLSQSIVVNGIEYEVHESINIDGNDACDNFFSGNGTDGSEGNPHILEYYYFEDMDISISIKNVNLYVIIRNCFFKNMSINAIYLLNCSNLIVFNCTFMNSENGITIGDSLSRNINIDNNTFIECNYAVMSVNTSNLTISNNYGDSGSNFFRSLGGNDINLYNNTILNMSFGLYLSGSQINIFDNTFNNTYDTSFMGGQYNVFDNSFFGSFNLYGYPDILNSKNSKTSINIVMWYYGIVNISNTNIKSLFFGSKDNIYLENNTIENAIFYNSNNNIIKNNTFCSNNNVNFIKCTNTSIVDNIFINREDKSLSITDCENVSVLSNIFYSLNYYTIFLRNTNYSKIAYNSIYADNNGIHVIGNSRNLNISYNDILLNNFNMNGISIGFGAESNVSYSNISRNVIACGFCGIVFGEGYVNYNTFDCNVVSNVTNPYPESWGNNYNDTNIVNITPNIEHIPNQKFGQNEFPSPIINVQVSDDGYNRTTLTYYIYKDSVEIDRGFCDDVISIEVDTLYLGTFSYRIEVYDGYYYSYCEFQATIGEIPSNTTIITENKTISTNWITIEWLDVESDGYYVLVNGTKYDSVTSNYINFSFPTENKTYLISVIAYNTHGNSSESNICEIITFFDLMPEKTTILTPSQTINDGHILIMWEFKDSANGYYIYINDTYNSTVIGNYIDFQFPLVNATYMIYVVSYNEYGVSDPSNVCIIRVEVFEEPQIPEEPENDTWIYIVGGIGGATGAGVAGYFIYSKMKGKKEVPQVLSRIRCKDGEHWDGHRCVPT